MFSGRTANDVFVGPLGKDDRVHQPLRTCTGFFDDLRYMFANFFDGVGPFAAFQRADPFVDGS